MESEIELKSIEVPKYVGAYQITGEGNEKNSMRFMFVNKPNVINRLFCRLLLGWVWITINN